MVAAEAVLNIRESLNRGQDPLFLAQLRTGWIPTPRQAGAIKFQDRRARDAAHHVKEIQKDASEDLQDRVHAHRPIREPLWQRTDGGPGSG